MTRLTTILSGLAVLGATVFLGSCSGEPQFYGSWKAVAPTDLKSHMPSVSSATSYITIDFMDAAHEDGGAVTIRNNIDIVKTVEGDSTTNMQPYDINVKALSSVDGKWLYDVDDVDDLLIDLDPSTLSIKIENASELTPEQVDSWTRELKRVISSDIARFTVIDDVEVSHKGQVLSFETHHPDEELQFRKVED